MTTTQAQHYGHVKALKTTAIALISSLLLFVLILSLLNFSAALSIVVEAGTNIYFSIVLFVLFGLTYFFSGKAAKEIIIQKRNFIWVAVKYAIATLLTLAAFTVLFFVTSSLLMSYNEYSKFFTTNFLNVPAGLFYVLATAVFVAWLWSARQMRVLVIQGRNSYFNNLFTTREVCKVSQFIR